MKFLNQTIAPLGMGCWPIGGAMFSGDEPLGYSGSDDAESLRTIHAALASGITLFDTAPAYGAGHAERLLGRALKQHPDALIATKFGTAIDEGTKQLTGAQTDPASVALAIDQSLERLGRDHIDLLLLHQNALPVVEAEALFDAVDIALKAGKIRAYGWSTDFSTSTAAVAGRDGFVAVEHAMNVLSDAPRMQTVIKDSNLVALNRSPLAMGLLSGKYGPESTLAATDIRATTNPKTSYFTAARPTPEYLAKLDAIREILTTGGRTLVQGALCWLWAKGDTNIPIPGARSVDQIEGIAAALTFGAFDPDEMAQIETLITRDPDVGPECAR